MHSRLTSILNEAKVRNVSGPVYDSRLSSREEVYENILENGVGWTGVAERNAQKDNVEETKGPLECIRNILHWYYIGKDPADITNCSRVDEDRSTIFA